MNQSTKEYLEYQINILSKKLKAQFIRAEQERNESAFKNKKILSLLNEEQTKEYYQELKQFQEKEKRTIKVPFIKTR